MDKSLGATVMLSPCDRAESGSAKGPSKPFSTEIYAMVKINFDVYIVHIELLFYFFVCLRLHILTPFNENFGSATMCDL